MCVSVLIEAAPHQAARSAAGRSRPDGGARRGRAARKPLRGAARPGQQVLRPGASGLWLCGDAGRAAATGGRNGGGAHRVRARGGPLRTAAQHPCGACAQAPGGPVVQHLPAAPAGAGPTCRCSALTTTKPAPLQVPVQDAVCGTSMYWSCHLSCMTPPAVPGTCVCIIHGILLPEGCHLSCAAHPSQPEAVLQPCR